MSSIQGSKRVTVNSNDITDDDGLFVKSTQIATLPIGTDDNSKLFKGSDIVGYATLNFLQDGELADINGIKTFISDTNQVKPSEGGFVNGDKTKLDGIATNANNYTLPSTVQLKPSEGAFVNGDKTKLDGIATNANNFSLPNTVQLKVDTTGFVTGDKTKLDGISTGAEVNVIVDWNSSSGDSQILNKPTIPDVSSFITASSTDTLTNKTFDCNGTGNSITNIENADIKSDANIDVAKINFNSDIDIKGSSGTHGSCRLISSSFNLHMASESGYVLELDTNRNNATSETLGIQLMAPETSSYGTSSLKEVFKICRNAGGDNDDWIGKINDSKVVTETDLSTKTSQQLTDKCFIANQNSGVNFSSSDGVSLSAYGNLFNGKTDHDLAHIQIHDGDSNSNSLILTSGGSQFGDQSSGNNSEIHNIQSYYTKKGSSGVGSARPLTIQRLGGSVSFGDPSLAPSAKIDEDATCTKFKINCDDNTITNIQASTVLNGDTLDATLDNLSNRITALEGQPKILAVCIFNGAASNPSYTFNNGFDTTVSNVRQGTGNYKFTLASPASGNYAVFTTVIESGGTGGRDDIICQIDADTAPTTSRFFLTLHEGDNSTNAGTLVDRSICVMVTQ